MCWSRRRSCAFSPTSACGSQPPSCSSRTTWGSSRRPATGAPSCMRARSSNRDQCARYSPNRAIRTRKRYCNQRSRSPPRPCTRSPAPRRIWSIRHPRAGSTRAARTPCTSARPASRRSSASRVTWPTAGCSAITSPSLTGNRCAARRWPLPTKPESARVGELAPGEPLVSVRDLRVAYALRTNAAARLLGGSSGTVRAIDGVDLDLAPGEVLGVVGESGSGKSTLGRALLGLVRPTSGSIRYRGQELTHLSESRLRPLRRQLQMVFQDPHASLNPSMTIGRAISDVLRIHGLHKNDRPEAVDAALERVGLAPAGRFTPKYPSELSGGQKQRAVIARAIALGPELLVADEPISMLDMSVRAKILELLTELKRDLGLTYIYITHDLASARFFCDRVAIMYLGKVVEIGPVAEIFESPRHPYTKALLKAVPDPDPSRGIARDLPRGEVPDAARPPLGCSFHPRCSEAFEPCGWETRDLRDLLEARWAVAGQEQFARESRLVGNVDQLSAVERSDRAAEVRPASGSAQELLELLEVARAGNPDEPFWQSVREMRANAGKVRVQFADRSEPTLQPVEGSDVQVSCHLYHEPKA